MAAGKPTFSVPFFSVLYFSRGTLPQKGTGGPSFAGQSNGGLPVVAPGIYWDKEMCFVSISTSVTPGEFIICDLEGMQTVDAQLPKPTLELVSFLRGPPQKKQNGHGGVPRGFALQATNKGYICTYKTASTEQGFFDPKRAEHWLKGNRAVHISALNIQEFHVSSNVTTQAKQNS